MRLPAVVVGSVLLVAGVLARRAWTGNTARARLRTHFGVADVETKDAIRRGIEQRIPVGSTEAEIEEFLRCSSIGEDQLSRWYPTSENNILYCQVSEDGWGITRARETWGVAFKLDDDGKLTEIVVSCTLTGL